MIFLCYGSIVKKNLRSFKFLVTLLTVQFIFQLLFHRSYYFYYCYYYYFHLNLLSLLSLLIIDHHYYLYY